MNKKPDQVIDEITGVVYPPAEAVESQLATIRAIIPSTIKMYKDTGDIHTIQPNLDMIQTALNYLRGAPALEFPQEPEDILKPSFSYANGGLSVVCTMEKENDYKIEIVGLNIDPIIQNPEFWGELNIDAIDFGINIPVICGQTYTVTQYNDILQHFPDDLYIEELEDTWVKNKQYTMEDDDLEYLFLIGKGRSKIEIFIEDKDGVYAHFDITAHIHFKEKQQEEVENG